MPDRAPSAPAFLAAALLAALAPAAEAQSHQERCFGVARAGANDGLDGDAKPGSSSRDFQGNAWVFVPAGTCTTLVLPVQPDGTPRRGALEPLDRDRP